jgi:hypothetical protein
MTTETLLIIIIFILLLPVLVQIASAIVGCIVLLVIFLAMCVVGIIELIMQGKR